MKVPWWVRCILAGVSVLAMATAAPALADGRKKLLHLGWDIPNTAYLRDHHAEMERTTPFDGVIFKVEAVGADGRRLSSEAFWTNRPWRWEEDLGPALADLRAARFQRMRHNLIRLNATPGDLDWFDDAAWDVLVANAGLMARLARLGGGRGLVLDPESYGKPQFRHDPASKRSFAETYAMARKRGRQFMTVVAREYPDMLFMALWLNSLNRRAGASAEPVRALEGEPYGLFPAFVDGLLDAAPEAMTLADGCESAYLFDGEADYARAFVAMRQHNGPAARLVSPENRAKYARQVQASFGFYLDAYLNPPGSPWHIAAREGETRLQRLERNLAAAVATADEYVWVYGEQCTWWPIDISPWMKQRVAKTPGGGRLWEEAMPGINEALAFARDPQAAAVAKVERLRAAGRLENLLANPAFSTPGPPRRDGTAGIPDAWMAWQAEDSKGTFAHDPAVDATAGAAAAETPRGSARAAGVHNGCFLQSHPVEPGRRYAVAALARTRGAGLVRLTVRWQDKDGRWVREADDRTFSFAPSADPSAWQRCFAAVEVPEGVGRLAILLVVRHQPTADDVAWFDEVALHRL